MLWRINGPWQTPWRTSSHEIGFREHFFYKHGTNQKSICFAFIIFLSKIHFQKDPKIYTILLSWDVQETLNARTGENVVDHQLIPGFPTFLSAGQVFQGSPQDPLKKKHVSQTKCFEHYRIIYKPLCTAILDDWGQPHLGNNPNMECFTIQTSCKLLDGCGWFQPLDHPPEKGLKGLNMRKHETTTQNIMSALYIYIYLTISDSKTHMSMSCWWNTDHFNHQEWLLHLRGPAAPNITKSHNACAGTDSWQVRKEGDRRQTPIGNGLVYGWVYYIWGFPKPWGYPQ